MAKTDDELLAEDMTESELAEGMEDALEGERVRTEKRLDTEGAEGADDDDAGLDEGEDELLDDDEDLDDDDLDDDEDDDLDEEEETDASGAKELADGYTEDAKGQVHRPDGTMASKEEAEQIRAKVAAAAPAAGAAKPAATQQGAPAADAGKPAGQADGGAAAKWEPFKITADRREHVIAEAVGIQRLNGHVFIAIPDGEKFNQFTRRLGLGVVAQRMSRDLDEGLKRVAEREQEIADLKENPAPSEQQIEAQVWLEALKKVDPETGQPRLAQIFDAHEIAILERDVKIALNDAHKAHATKAEERRKQDTEASAEEQRWTGGLHESIDLVGAQVPDLYAKLTDDQLREVIAELRPMTKALLGKEEDGTLYLTQHGAALIRKVLTAAAGSAPAPATGADPAKGQPATATAGDKHERFNEGVTAAKGPPSTSVKNRRDARDRSHRGNREERRNRRSGRRQDGRTREQRDEDALRDVQRNWLRSPTLDLED